MVVCCVTGNFGLRLRFLSAVCICFLATAHLFKLELLLWVYVLFCCVLWLGLSVPVQVIAWKDLSRNDNYMLRAVLNTAVLLTRIITAVCCYCCSSYYYVLLVIPAMQIYRFSVSTTGATFVWMFCWCFFTINWVKFGNFYLLTMLAYTLGTRITEPT